MAPEDTTVAEVEEEEEAEAVPTAAATLAGRAVVGIDETKGYGPLDVSVRWDFFIWLLCFPFFFIFLLGGIS